MSRAGLRMIIWNREIDTACPHFQKAAEIAAKLVTPYSHDPSHPITRRTVDSAQGLQPFLEEDPQLDRSFDLIVMWDHGVGTWSHDDYDAMQRRWPLARTVTVTGPWSAGGQRNNNRWPGSFYVPHTQWPFQLMTYLGQTDRDCPTIWDGPVTSTWHARLARANQEVASESFRLGLVGQEPQMLAALHGVCQQLGHQVVTTRPEPADGLDQGKEVAGQPSGSAHDLGDSPGEMDAWIWDLSPPVPSAAYLVSQREQIPGPCLILVGNADLLIAGPIAELFQYRNTVLLGKPFLLDELQAAIGDLCFQNGRGAD